MSKCKHIKRVRFDDARSWEYASLDLSPHVNVFVGESDSGKSNVVRNLRSLIDNDTYGSLARDGAKSCWVAAHFISPSSEFMVSLNKTADGKVNDYTIESPTSKFKKRVFKRVGVSVPEEVVKLVGLAATDGATSLHISDQFEPRFIVGEKSAQVAKTIGAACGIDRIAQAALMASKDARIAKSNAKARQQQVDEARQSFRDGKMRFEESGVVEALAAAEAAVRKHAKAEMLVHHASNAVQAIRAHVIDAEALRSAKLAAKHIAKTDAALHDCERLLNDASELESVIRRLRVIHEEGREAQRAAKRADGIADECEVQAAVLLKKMGVCPTCGRKT